MEWNLSSTESIRSEKAKIEKSSDGIRNFAILSLKRKNKLGQKRQMFMKREGVINLTEIYNLQNIKGNSR